MKLKVDPSEKIVSESLQSAALHHYLLATVGPEHYSYENNFGGAHYVFLRGVLKPSWRTPARELVVCRALRAALSDAVPQAAGGVLWLHRARGEARKERLQERKERREEMRHRLGLDKPEEEPEPVAGTVENEVVEYGSGVTVTVEGLD